MKNWIDFIKEKDPTLLAHGYIRLPRSIANYLLSEEPTTRHQVKILAALLIMANHTDGYQFFRNRKIACRKGELFTSIKKLADIIEIHPSTVSRILEKFAIKKFIQMKSKYAGTHIQIINYEYLTQPPANTTHTQHENKFTSFNSIPEAHKKALEENRRILEEIRKQNSNFY